jgi:hypothetical protein
MPKKKKTEQGVSRVCTIRKTIPAAADQAPRYALPGRTSHTGAPLLVCAHVAFETLDIAGCILGRGMSARRVSPS